MQIYFLVVATQLIAGFILVSPLLEKKLVFFEECPFLKERYFQFGLGITAVLAALFTLLKVSDLDVLILGDLVPALSGLFLGIYFILSFYYERLVESRSWVKSYIDLVRDHSFMIGSGVLIIAVLHFLLPTALFL